MDPQQILTEVVWEALEDGGQVPARLAGGPIGVFVAVYNSDYARMQYADPGGIDAYTTSGTAHSIAAGRISYLLDFRGPSVTVDTACSASLVAFHLACQSLRLGECDLAVAGGASLVIGPESGISLSKWGMIAPDGRCKTFDARADGYGRGEGCGVVVLKRLADAERDGDRIRAIVRGTAVNQDGRSSTLTAPNVLSQQAVVRAALETAGCAAGCDVRRGARDGDGAGRSHRGRGARRGPRALRAGRRAVRARLGQVEYRSPRGGRGHRRDHQDRFVPRAWHSAATRALPIPQSAHRLSRHAILHSHRAASLDSGEGDAHCGRKLLRFRRHQRARRAGGGLRIVGDGCRGLTPDPEAAPVVVTG